MPGHSPGPDSLSDGGKLSIVIRTVSPDALVLPMGDFSEARPVSV